MEENKVAKALYDHLISRVELGDYAKFENDLATNDAFRKAMFDEGSTDVDWGDYATFESNVKKKGSPLLDVGQGTGLVSQEPSKEPLTPQQPLPSTKKERDTTVTGDLLRTFTSTSKRMAGGMAGLPMLLNRTLATYTIRPIIKAMGATDEEAQQTVESIIRSNTMGQLASVTEEAQKVMNKSAQRDEQKMAQIEGSIWENLTKGKDGEKNVGAGFEQLGRMVVGFLPYSALTAATAGAGTMPVIATMGATAAAQKYSEMEGTAEPKRILNSWMYGGFEGVGEAASAVIFRGIGKAFRQGLAKQLPKNIALSFAKGAAESVGLEASSEVVTQIGQNFTDIVTGVDPQRGLFDGVLDVALGSAAFGLITGGGGRIAASVLGRTLASDKETEQVQTNLTQQGTLADQIESTDSDPVKKALESRLKTLRYEADKVMDKNFELAKELTPEQRMKVAELYSTWNELQAKIDNGEVTNEVGVKTIEDTVNGIKEEIQSIKEATLEKLGEIKKEGAKFKIGDTTFETEEAVEAWLDKNYQKRGLPPIWHTPTEKVIDAWYKRNKEEIDKRELQPLFKTKEGTKDATTRGKVDQTVSEKGGTEGGIGTVESIPVRDVSTDKGKAQGETGEEVSEIIVAPFYNTQVKSPEEADALRQTPEYQQHIQNIKAKASALGFEITDLSENIGHYTNDAGEKITELSNSITIKGTYEQAQQLAAVLGATTPEVQETTIAGHYVKAGDTNHESDEVNIEVTDFKGALAVLDELGIDYMLNQSTNTFKFLDFSKGEDLDFKNNIITFANRLKEKGIRYGKEDRRPTQSRLINAEDRRGILGRLNEEAVQRGQGGTVLRGITEEATKRNEEFLRPREEVTPVQETEGQFMTIDEYEEKYLSDYKEGLAKKTPQERRELEKVLREKARTHWKEFQDVTYRRTLSDKQDVYFIDAVKSGRITPQRAKAIYDSGGWNLPEEISKLLTPVQKPQEFTPLEQKYIEPNKQKEIVESFTHYKSGDKFYPRTIWADWFLGKDRKAKERIANEIEENPQLKNALLSFWYDEYIKQTGEKISFEEFLNKDIEIYRGESQQDIKTPDIYGFQTYAPTEQEARIWAEKTPSYTGKVIKTIVKPKNTYGLIQSVGAERELLVPTKYSQEFLSKIWDKFSGANEGVFNNLTEEQGDKLSTLLDANNYQGAIDELKKIIENKGIKAVSIPSPKEPQGEVSVTTTEAVTGEGGITAPPEQILPVVPPPVTPPVKGEEKRSGFEKRETPQGTKGSIELRTDEIGQIVRDIVDKNPHFYKELHREDALRQAQDLILSFKDLNDAYSNLLKKTTDLSSLPVRHVARQILIQKFGEDLRDVNKLGDKVSADAIADKIINLEDITQREVRISGQTSAMTMWKVLNPEATVFMVNKLFNDVNKRRLGFEAQQAEDFIEKWNTEVPKSVQRLLTENPDLRDFIDKIQAKVGKEVKNARTTKAKAKDIANKVRSLKSTNWGFTFADPIGAVAILDGALEVTAKTIEATGNILQAINDGIAEIKKSKWYNGLTSVKQKEVESKYREKIRANIDFDAAEYIEGQSWYKSAEKAEPTKEEKEKKVGIKEKSQASKRLKEQIYDVIASHWLVEKEGGESLVDRLVRDIGLTKSEAERIAKISEEAVRRDSEKVFERTLGDKIPNKKTRGNAFDKFFNLIKKGALTNENYYEVFAQKHKLKTGLTEEEKIKLKKLAITAEQMSPYGYFGDMAHDEFLQYMAKITEADSWLVRHSKLMLAANYARMLSGLTTHKVNLSSSAMNLLLRPISHGADMTQWMNVVLNMAKGNWKEAHVKNPLASLFYAGGAFATGARIGKTEALNIIKHGNIRQASKYMESVDNISGQNIPELDKNTFGVGKRFRPIMVGVGKWKVDLNPWNYMKYSGRTLLAEDSFMVNLPFALELSLALREKAIRAGEVGGGLSENKKLADKIFAQIAGENLTEEQSKQIESQLEEQVRMLQTQGIEPSASQIKQRRFELTRTFLDIDKEMVDELTQLARDNIFTSYRGGVFSQVGDAMGRFFNKHLAIKIITMPKIPFTGVLGRVADMGIDATPIYGAVRAEGWSPTGILARIRQWERTGDWRDFFVSPQKAGLFRSAQLGERGSKAYNQQMARQWLGLWSTLLLGAIFLPDDDKKDEDGNPWIDITGRLPFSDYEKKEQHYLGAYTAKIGNFKFRYLNYPVINMPFAIIGNYRDHIKAGVDPEDAGARMALLAHSWFHSLSMIKDTWLAKGINDMVELIGGVINTFGQKEGRERVRESDKIAIQEIDKRVTRQLENLRDDYTGLVIKYVDPLKSNLVQQLIKFGTPEGRLKGTGKQLWLYNSGLQWWNDKRTDIFGQEVKVMPGDQGIAWPRDNDQRWKKMWDYNIDLTDISPKDKITVKGVPQTLEWEDYIKRKKLTGELFTERFDNYFKDLSEEEIQKRLTTFTVDPRSAIKTNQIHEDVLKIWNNTKSDVSKSMFVWDKQVKANPMVFDRLMRAEALPDFHKPSIEIKGEKIIIPFDKLLKLNDDIMVRFVVRATPYLNSLSKEEFEKARTTISKAPKAKEGETKLQFKIRGYWESSVERPDKELELEMKREFGNTK